jgi:hypothetical protein
MKTNELSTCFLQRIYGPNEACRFLAGPVNVVVRHVFVETGKGQA